MTLIRPIAAIFQGFRLCCFEREVRRLAKWPLLLGAICYPLSLLGAYYSHGPLLSLLISDPSGWWQHILFALGWLVVAILLLGLSFAATIAIVMIFAGVFQTAIAAQVLRLENISVPEEGEGLKATTQEAMRSISVEAKKMLWLLPLMLLTLFLGLIPLFTPFALALSAWLLAYQFLDVALDCLRVSVRKRLKFGATHPLTFMLYGLCLSLCWAVPFLGIFLSPVAVAGGAWLLAGTSELKTILPAPQTQTNAPTGETSSAHKTACSPS